MLEEAFGEQALSQTRTSEWFKHFKDGRESVEDSKHSGRPYVHMHNSENDCENAWSYPRRLATKFVIALDCYTGHVNTF